VKFRGEKKKKEGDDLEFFSSSKNIVASLLWERGKKIRGERCSGEKTTTAGASFCIIGGKKPQRSTLLRRERTAEGPACEREGEGRDFSSNGPSKKDGSLS